MRVSLTRKSSNAKTGPIAVSYTEKKSCPESCPLRLSGCYASVGFYTRLHWDKVSAGKRGMTWQSFIKALTRLKPGTIFRHNIAGDLPGNGETIDSNKLWSLIMAVKHLRAFTYTHKPLTPENEELIRVANWYGFAVNVSANNRLQADEYARKNLPVVTILNSDSPKVSFTPGGHKIVVCPAQQHETITCDKCMLCAKPNRNIIIGFRAHGGQAKVVNQLMKESN